LRRRCADCTLGLCGLSCLLTGLTSFGASVAVIRIVAAANLLTAMAATFIRVGESGECAERKGSGDHRGASGAQEGLQIHGRSPNEKPPHHLRPMSMSRSS
jgi:hypothetical protein